MTPDQIAACRIARILDDMEGLVLQPADVARGARRIRDSLKELGIELPQVETTDGR